MTGVSAGSATTSGVAASSAAVQQSPAGALAARVPPATVSPATGLGAGRHFAFAALQSPSAQSVAGALFNSPTVPSRPPEVRASATEPPPRTATEPPPRSQVGTATAANATVAALGGGIQVPERVPCTPHAPPAVAPTPIAHEIPNSTLAGSDRQQRRLPPHRHPEPCRQPCRPPLPSSSPQPRRTRPSLRRGRCR